MQKWEYLKGSFSRRERNDEWVTKAGDIRYQDTEIMLAELGSQGWELVSVSTYIGSTGHTFGEYFYFKRPIE